MTRQPFPETGEPVILHFGDGDAVIARLEPDGTWTNNETDKKIGMPPTGWTPVPDKNHPAWKNCGTPPSGSQSWFLILDKNARPHIAYMDGGKNAQDTSSLHKMAVWKHMPVPDLPKEE